MMLTHYNIVNDGKSIGDGMDLSTADFRAVWDGRFVLFCAVVTLLSIGIAVLYSLLHKDRSERGEIIQASYRSSAAVLGIAFVRNIYGDSLMAALMVLGTVPLYNIAAMTVLSLTSPEKKGDSKRSLALNTEEFGDTIPVIYFPPVPSWSMLAFRTRDILTPFMCILLGVIMLYVGFSRLKEIKRQKAEAQIMP